MISVAFILMVVFQFKHFVADYPLQTKWMLGKFREGWDFIPHLAAHCAVHAAMTFIISSVFLVSLLLTGDGALDLSVEVDRTYFLTLLPFMLLTGLGLGALDFSVHFIMDRVKASPKYLGRYKAISGDEFNAMFSNLALIKTNIASGSAIQSEYDHAKAAAENKFQSNVYFWWSLGVDQMVHHLTDLFIVYLLVS